MVSRVYAEIEPRLLKWARETAGYDLSAAAQKLGCSPERLRAWEGGEQPLTIAQLRTAARVYRRPLAVFYLAKPPQGFSVLQDFRRLPEGAPSVFSPKLNFLIRRTLERQEWAADYRKESGAKKREYVGSERIQRGILEVARRIRQGLRVSLRDQQSWRDPDLAFARWSEACEDAGMLVFQSSDVPPDEMRGFAIPHQLAPAIMVNSKDTRAARVFTLLHEVAHILIGAGGISNLNLAKQPRSQEQKIEAFCNAVAAESLVPQDNFTAKVGKMRDVDLDSAIRQLSACYSVSREVIARRLLDLNRISEDDYSLRRVQYAMEAQAKRQKERERRSVPIPRSRIIVRNNGRGFTREVLAAYGDGLINGRDVSALLETKLQHVPALEMDVFRSRWKGSRAE